jgi:hypothetical protein
MLACAGTSVAVLLFAPRSIKWFVAVRSKLLGSCIAQTLYSTTKQCIFRCVLCQTSHDLEMGDLALPRDLGPEPFHTGALG